MGKQPQRQAPRQDVAAPSTQIAPQVMKNIREELEPMKRQFEMLLPAHTPVERFVRIILNAMQRTPRLAMCDRASFWNACMQSAEDGLLPDKREGAIVPFRKGKDDDGGSPGAAGDYVAVWIPMVLGVRKLIRNSGDIRDLNCQLVYVDEFERGAFQHELGDSPMLKHKRLPFAGDPAARPVYCAYSLAWNKEGDLFVPEIMFENEIMAVAARSKSFKAGPWSDPLFAHEMRKKTVTKRHFKQLPTNRDLDRVLRRDDALYDFEERKRERETERATIPGGTRAALDHFAKQTTPVTVRSAAVEAPAAEDVDPKTGEIGDAAGVRQDGRQDAAGSEPAEETRKAGEPATARQDAGNRPSEAELPKPTTPAGYAPYLAAWLKATTKATEIKARYKAEQDIRLSFRDPEPTKEEVTAWLKMKDDRLAALAGDA